MHKKHILNTNKIPQFWVISIVLLYSFLMAEFFNTFNYKIFSVHTSVSHDTFFSYIMTFNYALIIVLVFATWIVTSFLFHLFATFFSGDAEFKELQKYTGLTYLISAILFLIANFKLLNVEIVQNDISNIFNTSPTLQSIYWLINIAGYIYFILAIPIIKFLYNLNWIKSIGTIAIPIGGSFLLGKLFAIFIF